MAEKQHFLYRLIPPRPTFAQDQTAAETAIMTEHVRYWTTHLQAGNVVAFGPVFDPAGVWGLGIIEVDNADHAQKLAAADPAITSGLATNEMLPMLRAIVRPVSC